MDHILIDTNKLNKNLREIKPDKASGHDNNSSREFAAASDALTDGLNNVIFQKKHTSKQIPWTVEKSKSTYCLQERSPV